MIRLSQTARENPAKSLDIRQSRSRLHWIHPKFEIVLLDHGLYRSLSPQFRSTYAQMWYALLSNDEKEIYRSAILLLEGDEDAARRLHKILAAILTGREWSTIAGQGGNLHQPQHVDEIQRLQIAFPKLLREITEVLRRVIDG